MDEKGIYTRINDLITEYVKSRCPDWGEGEIQWIIGGMWDAYNLGVGKIADFHKQIENMTDGKIKWQRQSNDAQSSLMDSVTDNDRILKTTLSVGMLDLYKQRPDDFTELTEDEESVTIRRFWCKAHKATSILTNENELITQELSEGGSRCECWQQPKKRGPEFL